jgi:hypothetical protein
VKPALPGQNLPGQVLARFRLLSYNACHQPTVLAIAQRLPAAFFQGETALTLQGSAD